MEQHAEVSREEQLRRISHYESLLQAVQRAVSAPEASTAELVSLREAADALDRYYGGDDWKRDLADDEAGLLPKDLRRGVLSEDGVYNALETYRELLAERRGAERLIRYVQGRYAVDPEFPWGDDNFIFRHRENRKWFAVSMRVEYRKLGIDRDGVAEIVDVKCSPLLMGAYRGQPGILPGWHMNKEHWLTILLDGTAEESLVRELLEISFDLTSGRGKA